MERNLRLAEEEMIWKPAIPSFSIAYFLDSVRMGKLTREAS